MTTEDRTVRDSMGELKVPSSALWDAQTQRAVENFPISGLRMPGQFIRALGLIKWAAAATHDDLGLMPTALAGAIKSAAMAVAEGRYDDHFPVDVFQTGSGTSSNMNANEVIANLASRVRGVPVHPNDDVNKGQSSNDVIPSAVHLSAALGVTGSLLPALDHLANSIERKAGTLPGIVKTGRTHLMDAMPIRLEQELSGWAAQVRTAHQRIAGVLPRLTALAQGGTAVGTGINAHPEFGARVAEHLSQQMGIAFRSTDNHFEAMSCQDTAVELSGQMKTGAVSLLKIANDLRWMNSGPLAGLGEIELPALQPGSSIMPGKVNPVIPEAVAMAAAQVIGNDTTITVAGQSGNFQLNVMLPVIVHNLLQSIEILSNSSKLMADSAIAGFTVNEDRVRAALQRNPILVTALNHLIGYDKGAEIAKRAYREGRSIIDVAAEHTDLSREELESLLDAAALTRGGIKG